MSNPFFLVSINGKININEKKEGEDMSLSLQMAIKRNILFIRLRGELDQASVEGLKYRVTEVLNKY